MSYASIALLRWSKNNANGVHNNKNAKFLVIKDDVWQFWECTNKAIGAGFQRGWFEKQLSKHFNFDFTGVDFKYVDLKEYEGKDSPSRSAYLVQISPKLYELIDEMVNSKDSKYYWKNFEEIRQLESKWKSSQKFLIQNAISGKVLPSPPAFDNDFLTAIEQIQDAKDQGNLVIFVGAGVSKNCGVPLWNDLISELQKLIPDGKSESDYLVIPQLFYNQVGETQYHKTIQRILRHNRVKYDNKLHQSILSLKPAHIITTNYDNLIEQAIHHDTESLNYSLIYEDKDLPFANSPNFLVKMHGDFDKKNIVLKEDDYLHYQNNFPLIENFIKGVFSSKLILFIGFSYSDTNLKFIVERVRNVLQKDYQPAFLFDTKTSTKISKHKVEYYKKRGVQIVHYDEKIETYLRDRGLYEEIQYKKKNNIRGQKTFEFLHFINNYDRFTERSKNLHIVDQMFNTIEKYDEFISIPPSLLEKIRPFSVGKKREEYAKYYPRGFHFQTKNEAIIKLLKKLEVKDGQIHFKDKKFEAELSNQVYDAKDKLESIFRKLNATPIFCIQRKDDGLSDNHHRIRLDVEENCQCPRCKFNRLEIDELLMELNSKYTYDGVDDECKSEFNKAYIHFFCGNILTAYRILNRISLESYKEKKFITYFLAKYNIAQILWRVKGLFVPSEISIEGKQEVLKKIETNNIHALIEALPIEELTKKTFHDIENGKMIQTARIEMEKRLVSIKNIHKLYENEGSQHIGADYFQILYHSFAALRQFLQANFCYEVIYQDFRNLASILWEGALISHSTSERYKLKLEQFDYYLFDIAIFHVSSDDLSKLFIEYHPSNIKAENDTIIKLITHGINLFSSNHQINHFFRRTVDAKSPFLIQKEKSIWFQQRMKRYGSNILVLLSHLNLENVKQETFNKFFDAALNYLIVEGRCSTLEEKYFAQFFAKTIQYLSEEKISQLIDAILSDDLYSKDFIEPICDAVIKEHSNYQIANQNVFNKIINRITPRCKLQIRITDILPFYPLLSSNLKTQFQKKLIETIYRFDDKALDNIDWNLYVVAISKNIIEYNQDKLFNAYLKIRLNKINPINKINSKDEFYFSSEYIVYFLKLFYEHQITLSKKQKKLINRSETHDFFKWVLLPASFDYEKFHIGWLILVGHIDVVIERIASMKIQRLKSILQTHLKEKHHSELSEIYWKYFVD